jgi:hypothetical protein
VGHTGVVEAGIKAVETIDRCVQQVLEALLALGGRAIVTADHGNCELMRNADGSPNTAHTTNLVHYVYVRSCKCGGISFERWHSGRCRADLAGASRPGNTKSHDRPEPPRTPGPGLSFGF